ncbi:type VII secretion protein EccB [Streptomyces triticagri]|uniref:Type VII secretion protein EccB n=1 Tax=Streptomyces triticagri TaxID=2293568 RepID=A0A372LXD3_9ACTN|nr:type VII secretion protein EccB [Streptomyces triticagri]RFU83324.1 type VII secretion protein EccB [Streptomyces triticagri]
MTTRRDELNAYTFANGRLVSHFLGGPAGGGRREAPRPLRGVVPGAVAGAVVLAAFGAWGMFRPVAPEGWDTPGRQVIVAGESTTRYVVLRTEGRGARLHPVLNMTSARLLLAPDRHEVVTVDESVLDSGRLPHGPTLGIPYAPDRLPSAAEAGAAMRWAMCSTAAGAGPAEEAVFVLAPHESGRLDGRERLRAGELLYVQGPDGKRYVVDAEGRAHRLPADELLIREVAGHGRTPHRVSAAWLATLHKGDPIRFPRIPGTPGADAGVGGGHRVGTVLRATDGSGDRMYVVLPGQVAPVTDFTARLLLNSPALETLGQHGRPRRVSAASIHPGPAYGAHWSWPRGLPRVVDSADAARQSPSTSSRAAAPPARATVCSVLEDVDRRTGRTTVGTWAGTRYPVALPDGRASAYVTPGAGQLVRQFQGTRTSSGPLFLVTDNGLRYALQSNGDSAREDAGIGLAKSGQERAAAGAEPRQAQSRLGYGEVDPAPLPAPWSSLLPLGPRLSTGAARQPQGS